jgi:hypothetical protein
VNEWLGSDSEWQTKKLSHDPDTVAAFADRYGVSPDVSF